MGLIELFRRNKKTSSGSVAQERLRLVLAHDRANISPGLLAQLKDEIITVISGHIDIDADGVEVTFTQGSRESRLVADIPLLPERRGRRPNARS